MYMWLALWAHKETVSATVHRGAVVDARLT